MLLPRTLWITVLLPNLYFAANVDLGASIAELLEYPFNKGYYKPLFPDFKGESCKIQDFQPIWNLEPSAIVSIAKHTSGVLTAMKRYQYPYDERAIRLNEVMLHKLNHKNIPKGMCTMSEDDVVIVAMEYNSSVSISAWVGNASAEMLKTFTEQMIDVLLYLRAVNVFHNDIKTDGIVFETEGAIKLIDFGLATYSYGGKQFGQEHKNGADWCGFGITLHHLIVGQHPFDNIEDIEDLGERTPLKDQVAGDFISLLRSLEPFEDKPTDNIKLEKLLEHEFLGRFKSIEEPSEGF